MPRADTVADRQQQMSTPDDENAHYTSILDAEADQCRAYYLRLQIRPVEVGTETAAAASGDLIETDADTRIAAAAAIPGNTAANPAYRRRVRHAGKRISSRRQQLGHRLASFDLRW